MNSQLPTKNKISIQTTSSVKITSSYRGFRSIDQEIEREIALHWFSTKKSPCSQRNFLLKNDNA